MSLTPGQSLTHYEIIEPIGAGGMGEVWRARDSRLEREARALASLNHPNVAGIHGIDQVGDTCFLAMELVPGEDLAARLSSGPLRVDEAVDICRQIAEGLEAAHEAGVVHRDLKPANVRITPEGAVKLLDFGLAKPLLSGAGKDSSSTAQSDIFLMTEECVVPGTPTYMSPEQARGRPVDRRTDVWAFGCVLYECLTGRRAFAGETFGDVVAAVLSGEPDWPALPALPPRVAELLWRALTKDPRACLRDMGEARVQLELAKAEAAAGGAPAPATPRGAGGRGSGRQGRCARACRDPRHAAPLREVRPAGRPLARRPRGRRSGRPTALARRRPAALRHGEERVDRPGRRRAAADAARAGRAGFLPLAPDPPPARRARPARCAAPDDGLDGAARMVPRRDVRGRVRGAGRELQRAAAHRGRAARLRRGPEGEGRLLRAVLPDGNARGGRAAAPGGRRRGSERLGRRALRRLARRADLGLHHHHAGIPRRRGADGRPGPRRGAAALPAPGRQGPLRGLLARRALDAVHVGAHGLGAALPQPLPAPGRRGLVRRRGGRGAERARVFGVTLTLRPDGRLRAPVHEHDEGTWLEDYDGRERVLVVPAAAAGSSSLYVHRGWVKDG